jgi:hypothetical protein
VILPFSSKLIKGAWLFNTWNEPCAPGKVADTTSPAKTLWSGVIISKYIGLIVDFLLSVIRCYGLFRASNKITDN